MSFANDNSSDEGESTSADDWCYEYNIISSDTRVCGALGRAHKRTCPMSSRSSLPTEVYSTGSRLSQSDSVWVAVAKPKLNLSKPGKRKSQDVDKHPVVKKQRVTIPSFEVGNHVCLHSHRLVSQHVPCRIVRKFRKGYQLYCKKGILNRNYSSEELTSLDDDSSIMLDAWHQASRISLKSITTCVKICNCVLSKSTESVTNGTTFDNMSIDDTMWVQIQCTL